MTENPVLNEFNAAAVRFREELKRYNADEMLAALRDAAQEISDSGTPASLEIRPRLEGAAVGQTGRVFANATLTVEGFSTNWTLWHDRDVDSGKWVNTTSLTGYIASNQIAQFKTQCPGYEPTPDWRAPDLMGKPSLKDALIAVVSQARAEHEILGGYNVGVQPSSLQKPYVPGLRALTPGEKMSGKP